MSINQCHNKSIMNQSKRKFQVGHEKLFLIKSETFIHIETNLITVSIYIRIDQKSIKKNKKTSKHKIGFRSVRQSCGRVAHSPGQTEIAFSLLASVGIAPTSTYSILLTRAPGNFFVYRVSLLGILFDWPEMRARRDTAAIVSIRVTQKALYLFCFQPSVFFLAPTIFLQYIEIFIYVTVYYRARDRASYLHCATS